LIRLHNKSSKEIAVADEVPSKSPGPFDVRTIKSLVALMTQHDLSEIDLRDGSQRLRLRRGPDAPVMLTQPNAMTQMPAPAVPAAPAPAPNVKTESPAAAPAKKLIDIKSPTPGTFYSAPKPGEPPFVRVGSKVTPETIVGLIEAMKLYNEINAECNGVIAEILVENQSAVEYGQVLIRVDPAG
jgi:acetyl-CoA carboxylase biotin carboxyl carrier protein